MNCITNDELAEIDAMLSRGFDLPFSLASKLRAQLAANAADAVRRNKDAADLRRKLDDARAQLSDYWEAENDVG